MDSKRNPKTMSIGTDVTRSFTDDDRAIEGLPIRLVIALIIGVVSLGIMLQILGTIDTFETNSEVDVEFVSHDYIEDGSDAPSSFQLRVADEDDNDVPDATVIATGSSARMDGAMVSQTNDDGIATFDFEDEVEVPPDADHARIEFDIDPPNDSNWENSQPNNELTVVS
ncbi:hypothetical protein AB7C87_17410 [Natrarchaeobius sp. A-rgal3]|uniref:DUF7382 domain-containing protein n=1 Tax=Natrarchaeobius versutus TaxID=1679078 RepID=UPI00351040DF